MAHSWSRDTRRMKLLWALGQAGIVIFSIYLYFRIRNITEGSYDVAVDHADDLVEVEEALGIAVEDTLQKPFLGSNTLEGLANNVYIYGHWPVIVATMLWTVWRHRAVFLRLRDAMIVSGLLGMVVFVSWPLAPPRLADLGMADTITQDNPGYRILQPAQFTNQFAAMPSLHAGWNLLMGLAIVAAARRPLMRLVGVLLPMSMVAAVVLTANHYIVDVLAGTALTSVCWILVPRLRPLAVATRDRVSRRLRLIARHIRNPSSSGVAMSVNTMSNGICVSRSIACEPDAAAWHR